MAERRTPTLRRKQLGLELRAKREAAGKTGEDVAAALGWSDSKVSRIETGKISVSWGDVSDLLDLYGITDPAIRDPLIALARESKQQGWWQPYTDVVGRAYSTFIGLETAAHLQRVYESLTVPGLLQSEDYARVIIATTTRDLPDHEADRQLTVRKRRQEIVFNSDDPLRLAVVLDEAALHREVGGPQVMHEQLRHLIATAAQPRVRLQVIPFTQGSHVGMGGSFGVFSFADPADPDIAFTETTLGTHFLERRAEVQAALRTFEELSAQALSREDTLDLLTTISAGYRRRYTP